MKLPLFIIGLALLATFASAASPCPLQYQIGSVISARVIVAQQQSLVALVQGIDVQCYNYSLPYSFTSPPNVAVAVHDLQTRNTQDLFFSIKPVASDSLAYVPFLIRTHWRYTAWTKIGFTFLAEDRTDLDAGFYQIESGMLGGCQPGKNIQITMPIRTTGFAPGQISHNVFLNGFEISVQSYNTSNFSPFEIQIAQTATNSSAIIALLSVTTVTQVHVVHVSYLAWVSSTTLNLVAGTYIYEMSPSYEIRHTPIANIGRNYARIHGLTGFIINYNSQSIIFSTTWTGSQFLFDLGTSQSITQYFAFQYVFFVGSQCSYCTGYSYFHDNRCLAFCPPGSNPTAEMTCIICGEGYFWTGSECRKLCPDDQILNQTTNQCQCPAGYFWTGYLCILCDSGKTFNNQTKICECPPGTRWNGYGCAPVDPCLHGTEWNNFQFACKCPIGTYWNGTYCYRPANCQGGQYLNERYECECPPNMVFRNGYCQPTGCTGGQIWNGTACICQVGAYWNGSICLLCINGQVWDSRTRSCKCEENYRWNGNFCEKFLKCSGGRVYNTNYQQCLCQEGKFWNGAQCMIQPECCCGKRWDQSIFRCECPEGFNWDRKTCVLCTAGKIWDTRTRTCVCPAGTQWNNQFCTVIETCRGGMIWNQNTWACQCSSSLVWNGTYCIPNPCYGGQIWDNFQKKCLCIGNYTWVRERCVPPQIYCTYGRSYDPILRVCVCPPGTWDSGFSCETIQVCISNQIYNPLNNKCICRPGLVWLANKNTCGDPTCPAGERWDGHGCVQIACPPNSYYNGTECICPDPRDKCQPWQFYNGFECVYYQDTCPVGTRWNQTACVPIGGCPAGFYGQGTACKPLPQRCIYPTVWNNGKCTGNCPAQTYSSGSGCQPYSACQNGQTWNTDLIQCVCPEGTGWNGNQCVTCGGGQVWDLYEGCMCPEGYFFKGDQCEQPDRTRCSLIPNAYWNNNLNKCTCDPGFSVVAYQCICKGVPFEHYCDRCAHRPNSEWRFGMCQCLQGYTLYGTECLPNQSNGNDTASDCTVGTFFDSQQKKCISCPAGCLSCSDSYTCQQCSLDFTYNDISQLCIEICGDGKRYVLECDDGDSMSADGCDTSCRIEPGFTCRGGSPNSPDSCILYNPSSVSLIQTGQVRYATKIVINVKLDYMPLSLIQSDDCFDSCSQVLIANVTGQNAVRIRSTYIAGTRYSFSVQLNFDRAYIARFSVLIRVNPTLGSRFFSGINIGNPLVVDVNPAQLSIASNSGENDRLT